MAPTQNRHTASPNTGKKTSPGVSAALPVADGKGPPLGRQHALEDERNAFTRRAPLGDGSAR